MTKLDSHQTLLAVNSTEWLNLCARGSIRMSKRRPVITSNPASDREMEKVYASAPFTKMGSSVDLFILVLDDGWIKSRKGHRSNPSEILLLSLSDVLSHYPLALEHLEYYRNLGSKCGVRLEEPIFEQSWLYWITNETIQSSCDAAELLQRAFLIHPFSEVKRLDRYKWNDIARLVLRPDDCIKSKAAPIETLLTNIRKISDAVASTRDSEQFYLASAIEWIDVRLNKNPLKKKAIREILVAALNNAKELPLGVPSGQTSAALQLLAETYPKGFTSEISPVTIAQVVQLSNESRSKKLKPETVIRIIDSLDRNSPTASMITFLLATFLGIEYTNQLVIATNPIDFVEINWETTN